MENKIYNQCREEAKEILRDKYKTEYVGLYQDEINQLTAEIYAQKFIEWGSKSNLTTIHGAWCLNYKEIFSTTAQLHSKFVEENKGGENENN
jgi:hypothetical protein